LDGDINLFADELKLCFSKDEIEEIARETGFVKRKRTFWHAFKYKFDITLN